MHGQKNIKPPKYQILRKFFQLELGCSMQTDGQT